MRNARGFNVWSEVYFSGSENVTEFLEGIDNQIKLLEIPSDLSCAYLIGHLLGRALDWYQMFGSPKTEPGANGFCLRFAEIAKKLELGMSEKALVARTFDRLEPQVQDYVEVRNPQNAIQSGMGFKTMIADLTIEDINLK
ncbi:uncharacterized protein TNCV_3456221 [Trichonephila clavipes]|nr:uncharacterized protein TNCV_3456221 [Trichonephila clavipes]